MKVRDVMTKAVAFCRLDAPLSEAAELMWTKGCGFLPVVGEGGHHQGIDLVDAIFCTKLAHGPRRHLKMDLWIKREESCEVFNCGGIAVDSVTDVETRAQRYELRDVWNTPAEERPHERILGCGKGMINFPEYPFRRRL